MNIDYNALSKNKLFAGIEISHIPTILKCLGARIVSYKKGGYALNVGEKVESVGIVITGKLAIIRESENGARNIIEDLEAYDSFGEALACAGVERVNFSVTALENSEILLIDYKRIVSSCSSSCSFHRQLIENMLSILSIKLLNLNNRLDIASKRRTREKLLTFFEQQKNVANQKSFTISFNREELADFLFVDRSAMSNELCKMRDEGLIAFHKNQFELLY